MHFPPELLPVFQITVPLLVGLFIAAWVQNKRLDDIVARLSALEQEVRGIRAELSGLRERVTRLEERIPPLVHR